MTFWKPEHLSACLAFCSARWGVSLFLVFLHSGLEEVRRRTEGAAWGGKQLYLSSFRFPSSSACLGQEINVCARVHMGITLRVSGSPIWVCSQGFSQLSETCLSDSRNSSFLTQPAKSCFLKCWINWQVAFSLFSSLRLPAKVCPLTMPTALQSAGGVTMATFFKDIPPSLGACDPLTGRSSFCM